MSIWAQEILKERINNSTSYQEIALLEAISLYIKEQEQRIESLNGQLEGKMWSPSNW